MDYEITIDEALLAQHLTEVSDRLKGGFGPDWAGPAISMEISAIEREWFDTEGQGTWPPLSPATVVARANRQGYYSSPSGAGVGGAGPILQWTQRLRNSLADPRGRGAPDAVIHMTPESLEQGTLVPYAKYHMGGGKMPARPPVKPLGAVDLERLSNVYLEYVLGGVGDGE